MHNSPFNHDELIRSFLEYLTIAIDVAKGIVIAMSIIHIFIMFFKILHKSVLRQTKSKALSIR
jgi:hypothetical protein